jgi:DNA repair protein RecN (Recombination protein N)
LSETLIELHGQHDDRGLLDPKGHRILLDSFAETQAELEAVKAAWRAQSALRREVERTRDALEAIRAEEEFLRHAVAELDKLNPEPGEDAALDARRRQMQAAEKIRDDVARALELLGGQAAEGAMSEAVRWLDGVSDQADDMLTEPLEALNRAQIELGEAQDGVARCLDALEFNPAELEATEERLFAIRALARKHDVLADDLAGLADRLRERLASLDAGDANLAQLEADLKAAGAEFDSAAAVLSAKRRTAAERLDQAVMKELAPLKMERAVFCTEITDAEPGPEGTDQVAFTVATNPGAPSGPLNKIASGGELSRFLLALKVCLRGDERGKTLIFDEIDRGVGGATADAVGRRLAALSNSGQVLVVTHSPQVAARGAHHWRVQKAVVNEITLSSVVPLDLAERVDEIARMVSGDTITEEARAAARSLLEGCLAREGPVLPTKFA